MNPTLHFIPYGLFFISFFIFVLGMINMGIVFPLIFNFKIIPKIEKQVGEKLDYYSVMMGFPFSKFIWPCLEVSYYIFLKYLTQKTKINFAWFILQDLALKKINYDIRQCSRFDVIMSIIVMLNAYICAIAVTTELIVGHIYNLH